MPDVFQGHIDAALTNYALRYRNNELIADEIAPRVEVDRQSDKYPVFGRENMEGASLDDTRAPSAQALEVKRSMSTDSYFCPDHARKSTYPLEESQNNTFDSTRQAVTQLLMDQILLGHEYRTAKLVTTAANLPAGNKVQLAGNDQWNSGDAAADPFGDMDTARDAVMQKTGKMPNLLVLGYQVFSALTRLALVKSLLSDNKNRVVTLADLQELFKVPRIIVGSAVSRSAGVNSFIWGKHAVLLYTQAATSKEDVSACKTFVWRNAPRSTNGMIVGMQPHPFDDTQSEIQRVHFYHDEKITASESIYLIEDAVA